jgi:2-polyprenyl-6-hydroxyphenyl methylase/3-demethylubiquinone-9 3-methyltransferase
VQSAFTFGENWLSFSRLLDDQRIAAAEESVSALLQHERLDGLTFLDAGAGSGLFSIAALRLGAARVVAVDRDVNCLQAIKANAERFAPRERLDRLEVWKGDMLDAESLPPGQFDVVYAWGSLHHTGEMWKAVQNAADRVRPGGIFGVALYNRTWTSPFWLSAKRLYHASPAPLRVLMAAALASPRVAVRALSGKHPIRTDRGMSVWYDAIDWLGGLPYEYASSAEVEKFLGDRGFETVQRMLTRRLGCNEMLCRRLEPSPVSRRSDAPGT